MLHTLDHKDANSLNRRVVTESSYAALMDSGKCKYLDMKKEPFSLEIFYYDVRPSYGKVSVRESHQW